MFYSNKYTEVTKYLSDMNPFYCIDYQYVCESWLNSLPEDVQDKLVESHWHGLSADALEIVEIHIVFHNPEFYTIQVGGNAQGPNVVADGGVAHGRTV